MLCHQQRRAVDQTWGLEPGYLNTTDSGSTAFVIVDNVVKDDNISAAISKITGV